MPSIVYDGLIYTQTRHAIKCRKCLETIESKHSRDFKYCSCKTVGIDGGISSGNRVLGNPSDMEYKSMYCSIVNKKKLWLGVGGFIPLAPSPVETLAPSPIENHHKKNG